MKQIFEKPAWVMVLSVLVMAAPTLSPAGVTWRVSLDSTGVEANGINLSPSISGDARYIAFYSDAANLVAGDSNGTRDIFVHDRVSGATSRVSVSSAAIEGNGHSLIPSISADGRYVAFQSSASNLVLGDSNGQVDMFVHDRLTGATIRVSVDSAGNEGNSSSSYSSISSDGRYIAFDSFAFNLVTGDSNGSRDVFVHDRVTGATSRVSVDSAGLEGNADSGDAFISADGRYVAFYSFASNLVVVDGNGFVDIFVHDRVTSVTSRVSVDSFGNEGNADSDRPSISADGRFVVFDSTADNLVAGDNNFSNDIFVHDRTSGVTSRISVDSVGTEGNNISTSPSISSDGHYIAFRSYASNLVALDSNGVGDVFVHDRWTGKTLRASMDETALVQGNGNSTAPSISAGGRHIAFESTASNLVAGDGNGAYDIFVHDRQARLCRGQVPTMVGSWGADILTGTAGDDVIQALGGNDTISSGGGNDLICASYGHDIVTVTGAGNNTVQTGQGVDSVDASSSTGSNLITGWIRSGRKTLTGGSGFDKLVGGDNIDTLTGNAGNDFLYGSSGSDTLNGGAGTDSCNGGNGMDSTDGSCETVVNVP